MNAKGVRILFVNHTGAASGAEFALMRLVEGLRDDNPIAVACPAGGPLADLVDAAGVRRFHIPAFEASLRLHPLHTPVGLAGLAAGSAVLARLTRRFAPDVLHANTPRAGLMALVSRRLYGPPLVVRAHEALPPGGVGGMVRTVLARSASAIVTVSGDTARRFNEGLDRPLAVHVYNSFDRDRFNPDGVAPAGVPRGARDRPDARPVRPHRADHPVEGPGHFDPRPGASCGRAGTTSTFCSSERSPFPARPCDTTTRASFVDLHRSSTSCGGRRRPLPRRAT